MNKRQRWLTSLLMMGGALCGGLALVPESAFAETLQPTAKITINNDGATTFSTDLDTKNGATSALIAVPVKVEVTQADKYSMGIYLDCSNAPSGCATGNTNDNYGSLTDASAGNVSAGVSKIESTATTVNFGGLGNNNWGFWYMDGNVVPTVEGSRTQETKPVPVATVAGNAIAETEVGQSGAATREGQLVFGVKADGNLVSGSYSGKVVVTVTATPQEVADTITSFADLRNMQDMNPALCADAEVGDVTNLKDTRDGKYYVVGKLADGRCWMLQNLALEGGTTIYPSDSNITVSSYTLPNSAPTGANASYWVDDENTTGWMYNGYHSNTGTLSMDGKPTSNVNPATSNPKVSTGAYYSYMVATAGTGTSNTKYDKAPSSICPKGWHLPTGGDQKTNGNGEFQTLYEAYSNNATNFNNAFRYAATGFCADSFCPYAGSSGNYWSSTIFGQLGTGDYRGFNLGSYGNDIVPADNNTKKTGLSVRCVADNTMQSMTADACSALEDGDIVNLMDARDGKSYITGKLADGNCWMLQNLALKTGITLTSTDSDVSRNYALREATGWSSDKDAYVKTGSHQDNQENIAIATDGTFSTNTGNYYSFLAATADTGGGSSGNTSSSICPKGWKLPTGGNSGQFQALYNKYNDANSFNNAFKWAATGYCYSSSCPSNNTDAYYWSSTLYSNMDGYYLLAYSGGVHPVINLGKRFGFSVRCILVAAL